MRLINKKEGIFLVFIFMLSLLLSHLNIFSFMNQNTNPEYFIALFTIVLNSKVEHISLFKVFIMGLIIDIFIGQVLGQYAFSLLVMMVFHKIYNHYFSVVSEEHEGVLQFFTILVGIICLKLVVVGNLIEGINFISTIVIIIFTFLTFFVFQFLIKRFV